MYVTRGSLKRLSDLLAGQSKSAVDITGGTITGATISGGTVSGMISSNVSRVTAAVSVSASTTLTNITGLVQTVVPGTYAFRAVIPSTSGASGGVKIAFKLTTTVLSAMQAIGRGMTASAIVVQNTTTATDQASLLASTTAFIANIIDGVFTVTTGGTMQLQIAQNASDATATVALINGHMSFTRIA